MQPFLQRIKLLAPACESFDFDAAFSSRPFVPFSEDVLSFLQALSVKLMRNPEAKKYPDVITFAFWCRKGSLAALQCSYANLKTRLGRGVAFHITPSNVPVNFAYSMAAGLLAGNVNIVRIPSKEFAQVDLICNAIQAILAEPAHEALVNHVVLMRYDRDDEINKYFSRHCDVRIIWGGDSTIQEIRKAPLPPRAFDVTFSDRYSICAVNADEYVKEAHPDRVARKFYNDTYLFDQNACTAPHLIAWLGTQDNIAASQKVFWAELHHIVKAEYVLSPVFAVDKLTTFLEVAEGFGAQKQPMPDNLIMRVKIDSLFPAIEEHRCATGYFTECSIQSLDELATIVSRKYQTLAYYGFSQDELKNFVLENHLVGIDRIVPIGNTMDFSLIWDGYDLIVTLSRSCEVL